jgi:formylglycine-generating enzyme required for sulfatase activity
VNLTEKESDALRIPPARIITVLSDLEIVQLRKVARPSWASAIGRDQVGLWCELEFKEVRQRLRWIAPGRFPMGSPEQEAGRYDDEGPRHEVTLSQGYWMFDTPCTQALWEAVRRHNPSRFVDPQRPVEQVSWEDCQEFLAQLNWQLPGLALNLPTEAQWEYACRAGSETAAYAGDLRILGQNDAPLLDAIAWYGGNSGVDFELAEGEEASGWREKQYEFAHAGTRRVGEKAPNAWGLYDLLGNVWEWCRDGNRAYAAEAVRDPVGPEEASAARVIRGGSWYSDARCMRAAFRDWLPPALRVVDLGFRCVEFGREPGREESER